MFIYLEDLGPEHVTAADFEPGGKADFEPGGKAASRADGVKEALLARATSGLRVVRRQGRR